MNVMNQRSRLVIEALIRVQVSKSHAKALSMVLPVIAARCRRCVAH